VVNSRTPASSDVGENALAAAVVDKEGGALWAGADVERARRRSPRSLAPASMANASSGKLAASSSSALLFSLEWISALATQAVAQDQARNYEEAVRCYREASTALREFAADPKRGQHLRTALEDKASLYEKRLKSLERHLLSKTDLSELFKHCVNTVNERDEPLTKTDLDEGCLLLERAKRADVREDVTAAVTLYESGADLILKSLDEIDDPSEREKLRLRCLLALDRAIVLTEKPEISSGGQQSLNSTNLEEEECASPGPSGAQELRALSMEEVKSRPASMAGSTHSLYPTCVEIKRSESIVSGQSDFNNGPAIHAQPQLVKSTPNNKSTPVIFEDYGEVVEVNGAPLAEDELAKGISALSLGSSGLKSPAKEDCSSQRSSRSSSGGSLTRLLKRSASASALNSDDSLDAAVNRALYAAPSTGSFALDTALNDSCDHGDRDRNVTEQSFANGGLDPEEALPFLSSSPDSPDGVRKGDLDDDGARSQGSGSDSGFSDPSQETPVVVPSHLVTSSVFNGNDDRSSPVSDVSSIGIAPSLPAQASPEHEALLGQASPPSSSSPRPRRDRPSSKRSTGSSVRLSPKEEAVTVLCSEEVVQTSVAAPPPSTIAKAATSPRRASSNRAKPRPASYVEPETYYRAATKPRDSYVPPRAFARPPGDDEEEGAASKGCYYLMSCLDAFWIL